MGKMDVNFICDRFAEIIGWPYQSPGTNDQNGIDCSGAFVRAYKMAGESIYHGSNRIERIYCEDCFDLNGSTVGLERGMAIFKFRNPSESGYDDDPISSSYLPGGKYYNGDVRNYTHIGLVTSVNPLEITHATSPCVKKDTKLGSGVSSWRRAGKLKAVIYSSRTNGKETDAMEGTAKVVAKSGNTVNLRESPSTSAALVARVPVGTLVMVTGDAGNGDWSAVYWQNSESPAKGYMMNEFLELVADKDGNPVSGSSASGGATAGEGYGVYIPCDTLEEAESLIRLLGKATVK